MAKQAEPKRPTIWDEGPMLLGELAREIPSRPCYETLRVWCTQGKRASRKNHTIIVMESIRMTGGRASSLAAYWRFVRRLNSRRIRG